ncbi:DUF6069 family protein [Aeromicrobium duanguangcaii]|uniref:DUF6069 family protein n=1 Tax=Aeromicrobium duanguangcaii TaxID=2968086 RepID=A0ABY5KLB2_9ACTN|nr:DUF6069 family protein [Aeromicrobium duanguangcaii]MCD9153033.1 DUF6069 family protein [Aeromicrobium duanguangcaii]MCL3836971.1 DUF6069 family protein [Aeromicrobium duanguangcaii]UUI69861.1 DUF6069 family protein [Aeromicrobium duanguangcaii]
MSSVDIARPRLGRVALTGLAATVGAAAVTTACGALAKATGVDFEIPDGGESIPTGAFATVTAGFSLVGVVLAVALARWSARPARRFLQITVTLTAVSLVPPFTVGGNGATTATLVGLHLLAAAVVIPAFMRSLRG